MTVKQRKQQLRGRAVVGSAIVLVLCGMIISGIQQREDGKASEMIESTEDVKRFDMEEVEVEETITIEANPMFENIRFYDVPLSAELQYHVFVECDGYNIAPAILFSLMDEESDFNPSVVSEYGDIGIMQINPKWHEDRMKRLNCTDLKDPYQNITVGIDYLAWLIDINPDIYWVLMAYNKGPDKATELLNQGIITDYAIDVLERAKELEEEYGSN